VLPFCTGAIGGGETFGDGIDNAIITHITCEGDETDLLSCPFNTSSTGIECGSIKDAHVVCQGMCMSARSYTGSR